MTRAGTIVVCALLAGLSLVWWQRSSAPAAGAPDEVSGLAEVVPAACPPLAGGAAGSQPYLSLLRMMGEPPLGCGPMVEDEVYRIVLREGEPAAPPLSIRLSRSEGVHVLIARQYNWTPDADPARPLGVLSSRVRALTEAEWRELESALATAHFWDMPIAEGAASPASGRWQLEGRRGRGYHHVERTETGAGPFGELARYLLRVGGFEAPAH